MSEGRADAITLLIDFEDRAECARWRAIHDRVMGGRSKGQLRCDHGLAVFAGDLSLATNGGFVSVRREPAALRLRTDQAFDGVAYRELFDTRRDGWVTLELPWSRFEAVFRGRVLVAPPLQPGAVQQSGLMTADKHPGPFCLTLQAIESY